LKGSADFGFEPRKAFIGKARASDVAVCFGLPLNLLRSPYCGGPNEIGEGQEFLAVVRGDVIGGIATALATRVPTKPARTKDVPVGWDSGNVRARNAKLLEMRRRAAVGVHNSIVPRLDGS
jgi:hypothetical protein